MQIESTDMAFCIRIEKVSETEVEAIFDFFPDATPKRYGRIKLDKMTGTVNEMTGCPGDLNATFFNRAAMKLIQHHLRADYPQITYWES